MVERMSIYEFQVQPLEGRRPYALEEHRGKVLLIVNTASQSRYSDQYAGLQALHQELGGRGLVVLGFPSGSFGRDEPGTDREIAAFCKSKGVTFPLHAKCEVTGRGAHELFRFLGASKKDALGEKEVQGSFTKFVVDREGEVVSRHDPRVQPEALRAELEGLL